MKLLRALLALSALSLCALTPAQQTVLFSKTLGGTPIATFASITNLTGSGTGPWSGTATFGTAFANRKIICSYSVITGSAITLSSATIGGISAIIHNTGSGTPAILGFFSANVPTTTSGSVSLNFSASVFNQPIISCWTTDFTTLSSQTPFDSQQNRVTGNTVVSKTVAASSNGFILAYGVNSVAASSPNSISGDLVYTADGNLSAGASAGVSAHVNGTPNTGASNVTGTFNSSGNLGLVLSSWR